MTYLSIKALGAILTGLILIILTHYMGIKKVRSHSGSTFILIGFSLFFFSMLISIANDLSPLKYLFFDLNSEAKNMIEIILGTHTALLLMALGFYLWITSIVELKHAKLELKSLIYKSDTHLKTRTLEYKKSTNNLIKEIEQRKITEAHLREMTLIDNLTELPNRSLSLDKLNQCLQETSQFDEKIAILILDIDDFKKVNDSLGHEAGDELLTQTANRLKKDISKGDIVGRLGGDEFIIILRHLTNVSQVADTTQKLLHRFKKTFTIHNRQLNISASIGISIYPEDASNSSSLIRSADSAMYHSKEKGKNTYSFFKPEMNESISRRLLLEEQMLNALKNQEFRVFYQPKFNLKTNEIIGAEALIRWENSILGSVSPTEFIPLAEQTGIIIPLSKFVLHSALKATKKWIKKCPEFKIAVNLSPCQFRETKFIPNLQNMLKDYGISGESLELEITEGILMKKHVNIDNAINKLNQLGISIAMDDFGTGYSSLSYLQRYPFDILKIDRSFVNGIKTESSECELINATIAMAHGLNLKVVAEGIETKIQLEYLKKQGCDYGQGYFYSEAITEVEMSKIFN